MARKIPLMKPYMTDDIKQRVMAVLDSGYLTEGPITHELEATMASYIGCSHAIAVTSCTTGLELALRAMGITAGDEVIVPDYTYPATASAVAMVGASPVIVDVDPETMLISENAARQAVTAATKAIIPVSIFGNPLDYDWLTAFKNEHSLAIIEDAACSIGAEWRDRKVGTFADISVFSMHPRKFITTGEGGLVTTDNSALANWMQSFKHFGMVNTGADRGAVSFNRIGTNLKLSNVQAAIGLGQMQDIDMLLAERRKLASNYCRLLCGKSGITLPGVTKYGIHSWQTFCVFVDNRDVIMSKMRAKGIEVQIGTYSLSMQPAYQNAPCRVVGDMHHSHNIFARALALPLYHGMSHEEQEIVVERLAESV